MSFPACLEEWGQQSLQSIKEFQSLVCQQSPKFPSIKRVLAKFNFLCLQSFNFLCLQSFTYHQSKSPLFNFCEGWERRNVHSIVTEDNHIPIPITDISTLLGVLWIFLTTFKHFSFFVLVNYLSHLRNRWDTLSVRKCREKGLILTQKRHASEAWINVFVSNFPSNSNIFSLSLYNNSLGSVK